MTNYSKKISETALRIGEVRFSYANVFAPRRNEDGTEGKYSVQLLIPKANTAAVNMINAAIEAAKQAGLSTKFGGKMPPASKLHTPLRDGDDEFPDDENYAGMYFLNASSAKEYKPTVCIISGGKPTPALDGEDFYSGCYGAASVAFYAYSTSGNVGIACGLNGVIKTRDGEKLGGGRTMEQDFGDLAAEVGDGVSLLD
jgi:hypothetical protein